MKAYYSCSSLQDVWRVLHSVPRCKHRRSALLPQIPLPAHVLEPSLTVAESFCRVFRAGAAAVIVTLAEQLCCVSFGSRLLFASATPRVHSAKFRAREGILYYFLSPLPTSFLVLFCPSMRHQQRLCCASQNGNGAKGYCSLTTCIVSSQGHPL